MPISARYSEPVNLDAIRSFLSNRAPVTSMGLSDLDGFLTAIAIGPEPIMSSEWLPVVWGGEDSIFDDLDEAWSISSLIVSRYNDMVSSLQFGRQEWAYVFWERAEGELIVEDWAAGFLDALELRAEAWASLFEDRDTALLIVPILLADGERDVAEAMGIGPSEQGVWLRHAAQHIPIAVPAIHAFWKERRMPTPSARSSKRRPRRLRRREASSCRSGKEYNRYCGAH
jgi:uncharacterized protein